MAEALDSTISINSPDSQPEDWDRSIVLSDSDALLNSETQENGPHTPRNSIAFPSNGGSTPGRQRRNTNPTTEWASTTKTGRSLSELMKLHSEKGTRCEFSADEALRVADVLGQWINSSSSPYEEDDDFFAGSQDDLSIVSKRRAKLEGRARGHSESANSRPPSSTGIAKTS